MPANISFEYATVRVVPRVEREEFLNAGVVLFCLQRRFLQCRIVLADARLRALWPTADLPMLQNHLAAFERIAHGETTAGAIAALSLRERFHWLTAPRSTMVQTSPVRTGLCTAETDLAGLLERLGEQMLDLARQK